MIKINQRFWVRWLSACMVIAGGIHGGADVAHAQTIQKVNALGPVKVTTTLTPDSPVIGDEIQLMIQVESAADVEVLMPEFGEALSRYSILDFVPRQTDRRRRHSDRNPNLHLATEFVRRASDPADLDRVCGSSRW